MHTESNIFYQIDTRLNPTIALANTANEILEKLQNEFGNDYEIIPSEMGEIDKDWLHDIIIRKGSKIGAEVTLSWEKSKPEIINISVDDYSKLGSQITTITLLAFILIGAFMGFNHIAPLDFLPGRKIAAGLGGLIFIIPALIVIAILKSFLFKEEKTINMNLVNEVKKVLQN